MRLRPTLVLLAGTAAAALLVSTAYAAKPKPKAKAAAPAAADKYDPDNRAHISHFMETVAQGNAKVAARDFPGAIELYRKAIQLAPNDPLGHYLLGEAQLENGNMTEAEASWQHAANAAGKDDPLHAKVLFCLADLRERQKKWDDAKAAWQQYADFAKSHTDAGAFPDSATQRIAAIEAMQKQDKAYEVVRKRIADEEKAAAKGGAKKGKK